MAAGSSEAAPRLLFALVDMGGVAGAAHSFSLRPTPVGRREKMGRLPHFPFAPRSGEKVPRRGARRAKQLRQPKSPLSRRENGGYPLLVPSFSLRPTKWGEGAPEGRMRGSSSGKRDSSREHAAENIPP